MVGEALKFLSQDYARGGPTKNLLISPKVSRRRRLELLQKAFFPEIPPNLVRMLALLSQKREVDALPSIAKAYEGLLQRGPRVKVFTAYELGKEERKMLELAIRRAAGVENGLSVDYITDPELIAGVVIQIGDQKWDFSILSRLKRLRENLKDG